MQTSLFTENKENWDFDFHLKMCYGDHDALKSTMTEALYKYVNCGRSSAKITIRIESISLIIKRCES